MLEIKKEIGYFALGEFVAKAMLYGIIHPDMQLCNIGWDGQTFKFTDFADVRKISMPRDLTETTVRQLTESLYPLLDSITDELTSKSYFRAGFTAAGGVLCHTIFSNTVNAGLSSFLYTSKKPVPVSFDASKIYKDNAMTSAISEWKSLPLDKMALRYFNSLDAYNAAPDRLKASPFNMYYLDKLYFTRCYLGLSHIKAASSQIPILVMNMAVSAQHFAMPYTAFGLFQKCLFMNSIYSEVMDVCANGAKHIIDAVNLNPEIIAFIKDCIHLDLFELLWILDDLDKPLPPRSHFEFSDDESIGS